MCFRAHNTFWKRRVCGRDFGEFPNGLVLYLLVSDPRVSRPARKCKPTEKRGVRRFPFDLEALPGSVIDFWDAEKRKSVYTLQQFNS